MINLTTLKRIQVKLMAIDAYGVHVARYRAIVLVTQLNLYLNKLI